MGFKLVRIDVVERSKIPLQVGSHVIGRDDSLLNCEDQRVSRNHAVIKVSDDTVILESLHQNPCFYSKLCLSQPLVLSKGEWVSLANTDNFGLLPDSYWYELIFCDDTPILNNSEPVEQEMKVNDGGNHQVTYTTEFENINPSIVAELAQTHNPENVEGSDSNTLNLEFDEMEGDESQSLITTDNPQLENPDTPLPNNESSLPSPQSEDTNCDDQTITSKRSHTPENSSNAKKVKKEPDSPNKTDNPKVPTTPQSHGTEEGHPVLHQNPVAHIDTQNPIDANTEPQNYVTYVNYVNPASPNPTEIYLPPVFCNDLMLARYLLSMETEESQAPRNVNNDSESAYEADTNADPNPELGSENHGSAEVKKEPLTPNDKKNIIENPYVAMPGSSHDGPACSNDDGAATGGAAKQPDRPRERCLYGANCYRRNPQHKLQFSHPADPDYGPGATGQCPYGASCRRVDLRHWLIHDHPLGTVPPLPRQQGRRVAHRQVFYINARDVHCHQDLYEVGDEDGDSVDFDYEF